MKPNISEFSYGYAVTEELVHRLPIAAVPVFPSLYQEGQAGGGYDVMLRLAGEPLFLQFKLSDCMVRNSAKEVSNGHFNCPFYRMHLRPRRHSRQHQLLLELESAGNLVYYVAPIFHEFEELNDAYLHGAVSRRSIWINPLTIGDLPDDDEHHIAFDQSDTAYCYSVPTKIAKPVDLAAMVERIQGLQETHETIAFGTVVDDLVGQLREIARKHDPAVLDDFQPSKRHPLDELALLARRVFDVQLYLVRERG